MSFVDFVKGELRDKSCENNKAGNQTDWWWHFLLMGWFSSV
jgi:hypothetical protein